MEKDCREDEIVKFFLAWASIILFKRISNQILQYNTSYLFFLYIFNNNLQKTPTFFSEIFKMRNEK
jgi:hypothetical protein